MSDSLEITCGVPQGSVLGPLLFLLYVNDIYKSSTQLSFHLFADDAAIYYSHHKLHILQEIINTELKGEAKWLNANKPSLNMSKSSFILFHPPQKRNPKISLIINNLPIPEKTSTKYLGVILDNHLTWSEHIKYTNMKIHKGIGIFYKVRNFVNYQILKSLYYAFFQSPIDYCFNIWTCTDPSLVEPINVSMKKGIRALFFTKQDSHLDPLFKSHQLLNFTKLQTLHLSMFEWDLQHNNLPNTIYTILNRNNNAACRTKLPCCKYIPLYRTKYKKYFITTRSVPIWRDLHKE